jgi:hypothetical protein
VWLPERLRDISGREEAYYRHKYLEGGEEMKAKLVGALVLALILVLVFSTVAMAGVSQATINAIIKDAQDGTLDGHWSATQVRAALAYIENNPVYEQYSAIKGVLQDYLASLQAPGEQSGQLAFTGSNIVLAFGAGAALIGGGVLLRRRRAA